MRKCVFHLALVPGILLFVFLFALTVLVFVWGDETTPAGAGVITFLFLSCLSLLALVLGSRYWLALGGILWILLLTVLAWALMMGSPSLAGITTTEATIEIAIITSQALGFGLRFWAYPPPQSPTETKRMMR